MQRRELLQLPAALALAPQNTPDDPDLGNLFETINRLRGDEPPAWSFLEEKWKSLEDWKAAARPLFQKLLLYSPEAKPLKPAALATEERNGLRFETLRLPATRAYDIPVWVVSPANLRGRAPGIVASHCHSGMYVWGHEKILSSPGEGQPVQEFRSRAYGRPYAEELARRGFVVAVIDAFYFGSRRIEVEKQDPAQVSPRLRDVVSPVSKHKPWTAEWIAAVNRAASQYEHLTAKTIFSAGFTWPGIHVWDDRRTVDYLCSRSDVDPQRIGAVGLSIGGLRTAHLIGADPRVKAACVTGWMTEFPQQLRNHLRSHTWMIYVPGLYRALDLPDVAALTAPGALLVQQCGQDRLYPMSAMKSSVAKLERIYAKAGLKDRFRGSFYDVPHSFRPNMQDEAFAWLQKWLR
jgi:dienelactone hydrolase